MTKLARVFVFDNEVGSDAALSDDMTELGVDCVIAGQTDIDEIGKGGGELPQAIIVNSATHQRLNDNAPSRINVKDSISALSSLSKKFHIPLILLVNSEEEAGDMGTVAKWDDVLVGPVSPTHLADRIAVLSRLGTMRSELSRRLETAARYGVDAPLEVSPPACVDDATILILGTGRYFATVESIVSKYATLTGAFTRDTALDYLQRREFDAVIVEVDRDLAEALEFVSDVRRHPRHFNLPIIALGSDFSDEQTSSAYEAGFSEVFADDAIQTDMGHRTIALVREGRYRQSMRNVYRKARHMATSDALTGLYGRGFLLEHLQTMIAEAGGIAGSFSVAAFEIANIADLNKTYGYATGDRMIRQIGEILSLLFRGEDLTARYSGARFVSILPDTGNDDAELAVNRISSVIRFTEFSIPELEHPIKVEIDAGTSAYRPGDDPQAMITRSRGWISSH